MHSFTYYLPMEVFERQFKIDSSQSDFKHNLTVSAFTNMLVQVATDHADILKFGFFDLNPSGLSWVLSRFTIEFTDLPKWYDTIKLQTWSKGLNRLFYQRDTIAFLPGGDSFAKVSSDWLVIDVKSRRPKLFDKENPILNNSCNKHAIENPNNVLKFTVEPEKEKTFQIQYSDVDLNRHLTACRYIDFMFDMFDLEFFENNQPKKVVVNYLHEALFNEEVIMNMSASGQIYRFELTNKSKEKTLFKAEVYF